jgi:DNA-binding response OmpR family regulator
MSTSADLPAILLVEDEHLVSDLLKVALEEGGFHVLVANSGQAALDILARERAVAGLVSDVDLGIGPTGWEVARLARANSPQLAVVYMSGASAHQWEAEGVPNSTLLTKPFAPAQLLVAIAHQLNTTDQSSGGS